MTAKRVISGTVPLIIYYLSIAEDEKRWKKQ